MPQEKSSPPRGFGRPAHRPRSHESAHLIGDEVGDIHPHPMAPAGPATLITSQAELHTLLATLRTAGVFAYDSEFIGELTYVPRLCLIQVCWAGGDWP